MLQNRAVETRFLVFYNLFVSVRVAWDQSMGEIAEQSLSKFLRFLLSCYFVHKAWNRYNYWGIFRTLPNIYDGTFYEQQLMAFSPELFSLCFTFIKASSLIFDIALNTPVSFKDNSWHSNTDYNRAIHFLI